MSTDAMPAAVSRGFTANKETPSEQRPTATVSPYHCVEPSVDQFIERLAVDYLAKGNYFFYHAGWIPEGKDPSAVDDKLVKKYGINISKHARYRRRKLGAASIQYLRHGRFWVLLASHGVHHIFFDEPLKDIRREGIRFAGYLVTIRNGHVRVSIDRETLATIKAVFVEAALRLSTQRIAAAIRSLPFQPYAPVRHQLFGLLRRVNEKRKAAGLGAVPWETAVRTRRSRESAII